MPVRLVPYDQDDKGTGNEALAAFNAQQRCQICGIDTPKELRGSANHNAPELDHKIPMSKGGPHSPENLQCSCRKCNIKKGASICINQAEFEKIMKCKLEFDNWKPLNANLFQNLNF